MAADRDSQLIIAEKAACAALNVPQGYTVTPDPRSRFYDPTNPDCPQLPVPRPIVNGYQLPELVSYRGPTIDQVNASSQAPPIPSEQPKTQPLPSVIPAEQPVIPASFVVQPASEIAEPNPQATEAVTASPATTSSNTPRPSNGSSIAKVTIPEKAWNVLPPTCIARMLEFQSMRAERAQSFSNDRLEQNINVQRLNLENLMELATINSREYQTRKEILFRAALAVTRQRYRYELNPTQFGNGSAANYRHLRNNGTTVNTLGIPTGFGVQQTLASGGEFLARFANSVVLTFNGPSGFATDVSSNIIFDFQQTLFQRDVRFETLTQSERDVVYAARDYLRFRKQLFRDISNQYYNLLLNYRGIEINAQDYFTNLRGFVQSQAEYRTAEKIPRVQVDQFEQNVLRSRSNLIANCFTLESSLDQLKFRLGLPPELPIFLDLTELGSISLRDEFSVARQMITRTKLELVNARSSPVLDTASLSNAAEVLAERMMNILRIQERIQRFERNESGNSSQPSDSTAETNDPIRQAIRQLEEHQRLLQLLGARLQVDFLRADLDLQMRADVPVPPLRVLIRAIDYCVAELQVVDMAFEYVAGNRNSVKPDELRDRREALNARLAELIAFLDNVSSKIASDTKLDAAAEFAKIPDRMKESVELVKAMEKLAQDATRDILPVENRAVELKIQSTVDETIEFSDGLLLNGPDGWEEIKLENNEAMLTALVQRLDLMNQRGDLADAWRQIKLAGDDLRSIVDLQATQVLRTKPGNDKPFDFSFDNSETRLSAALDTPLNRRLQRNNFRIALINYNVGLRNLMAAEDTIKLDVREDLRQLQLDRNQYTIAVASAALAYERVISTRLRLQLGIQNVAARDFLESQQAYTASLLSIARTHVNYISDRLELFFDLEAFNVDQLGNWSGVSQDEGPQINVDFPATNPRPYDWLPGRVWYSPTVRQMESIPPGEAIIGSPP